MESRRRRRASGCDAQLDLPQPYLLFLGDNTEPAYAKTAFGLRDWARERCVGEFSCAGATVTTGLPFLTAAQARAKGARSMVIGVANAGGVIRDSWIAALVEAHGGGARHHQRHACPARRHAAARGGRGSVRQTADRRPQPPRNIPIASGRKRSGKRLLTVGTDCALGKKYTALAIARALRERGVDADFRATGQTGIMIAGSGMPMDAVVADFEAGAAEMLSPDAADDHWDVIEGQGSLLHPAYAAVSLGCCTAASPTSSSCVTNRAAKHAGTCGTTRCPRSRKRST